MEYGRAATDSISLGFVRALIERVEADGVPREALLSGTPIHDEQLRDPLARTSLATLDMLVEHAVALTDNPALGLSLWGPRTFAAFGVAGLATTVAASFRDSMQLIERYSPIFTSERLLRTRMEGEHLVISMARCSASTAAHRTYVEGGMSSFTRLLRQCAGLNGKASEARFDFPAPSYAARYTATLECDVSFDAPVSELVVQRGLADMPQLNHAPLLRERLCSFADALLREHSSRTAMHERVFRILSDDARSHRMSMEDVAERVGVSTRSLRRKLLVEGNPFPTITQRALRFHAELLLRDTTRSVKEVAFLLGFRDPSTFHRAVRRWSGQSPSALRTELARVERARSEHAPSEHAPSEEAWPPARTA